MVAGKFKMSMESDHCNGIIIQFLQLCWNTELIRSRDNSLTHLPSYLFNYKCKITTDTWAGTPYRLITSSMMMMLIAMTLRIYHKSTYSKNYQVWPINKNESLNTWGIPKQNIFGSLCPSRTNHSSLSDPAFNLTLWEIVFSPGWFIINPPPPVSNHSSNVFPLQVRFSPTHFVWLS